MTDTASVPRRIKSSRAWAELPVRPWLVMTLCLVIAAIALAGTRIGAYFHERRVIENGTTVDAAVVSIGLSAAREGSRDEIQDVVLRYTPPGSTEPLEAPGELPRNPGTMLSLKDTLHIRIDPSQPSYWTERQTPQPPLQLLVTPLLCLMVGVLSGFVAWLRRGGILRTVQNGQRINGHVVGVRQSPLAPLSKQIGVVIGGDNRRVLHCYWPSKLGPIAAGQNVDLIVQPPRVVVAALYAG